MAYEEEKNRLASIITGTVGITRTRDNALEREATERAAEASLQTGMNIGDADGPDAIVHPDAATRRARLGVPVSVLTAELATWNYLFNDPVGRAAQGLLTSEAHRAILDNETYDHWGIGIYTKMPAGETNELLRRWWFIIWLSNVEIEGAAMASPSQSLSKQVQFRTGTIWGYKFTWDGKVSAAKSVYIASTSTATASGRGKIPGRSGDWLLIANGALAGYWVLEEGFFTVARAKLT